MNITKNKSLMADILLFIAALLWGGGFVASKVSLDGFTPLAALAYRFTGAALVMFVIFHKKIIHSDFKALKCGAITGMVQFIAQFIQLTGLKYTTSAKQSFIIAAYVMLTPFVGWFVTRIAPKRIDIMAGLIALFGVGIISLNRSMEVQYGDFISLISTIFFALQIVLTSKLSPGLEIFSYSFCQFLVAGLFGIAASLVTRTPLVCSNTTAIVGILYLIIFNTAVAMVLQNIAQQHANSNHTAIILSLESVFGYIFSVLYYHEAVTSKMIVGGALVFVAIFVSKGIIKLPVKSFAKSQNTEQ